MFGFNSLLFNTKFVPITGKSQFHVELDLAHQIKNEQCNDTVVEKYFGNPEDANDFLKNPKVLSILLEGVMVGTDIHAHVIEAMKKCVPCIESEDQTRIMQDHLRELLDTLQSKPNLAFIFRFFQNISIPAQEEMANIICDGEFDTHPEVLLELIKNLDMFNDKDSSADVQIKLAQAIKEGKLRTNPGLLLEAGESLWIFTNSEAKIIILEAIKNKKFDDLSGNPNKKLEKELKAFIDKCRHAKLEAPKQPYCDNGYESDNSYESYASPRTDREWSSESHDRW